jgi:hypothetical protein
MFAPWQSLLFNANYVLFYQTSRRVLAPTHPVHQVPRFLSSAVRQPGLEDDYSPPFSAKVTNKCSYTSTSPLHALKVCIQIIMLRTLVNLHCTTLAVPPQPSPFFCTVQVHISYVLQLYKRVLLLCKKILVYLIHTVTSHWHAKIQQNPAQSVTLLKTPSQI